MYSNSIIGTHSVAHGKKIYFLIKIRWEKVKKSELLTLAGVSGSVGNAS
jgi:hypothetical protein